MVWATGLVRAVSVLFLIGVSLSPGVSAGATEAGGGTQLWAARFSGPGNWPDQARSVVASPDGSRVYVTGSSPASSGENDYATVVYDAITGARLWARRYNGPGDGWDDAESLAVSPDGSRIFVTGTSTGISGRYDVATVAYEAGTGAVLWGRRYDGPAGLDDGALAVTVSADGSKVFAGGYSYNAAGGADMVTLAYAAASGTLVWQQRHDPGHAIDGVVALAASPDGSKIFAAGTTLAGADWNYQTDAYDAGTGSLLWGRNYQGPAASDDIARAISLSPDGSKVFVTGESRGSGSGLDYATLAYDGATGSTVWTERYDGPGNGDDSAHAVSSSPDGSTVYVTGSSAGGSGMVDYTTLAYDQATGTLVWEARDHGSGQGDDSAASLAVSPDGAKVFVTGVSSTAADKLDYSTFAYDHASGATLWNALYDGAHRFDGAVSVASSPDGSMVFVTGASTGARTSMDYATLSYTA